MKCLACLAVVALLALLFVVAACATSPKLPRKEPERNFLHNSFTLQEGVDGDGHLAPSPAWECDVCEALVEEIVPILNVNRSMGETRFHREMDDLCVRFFEDVDTWLIGFCQYIVDANGLEFYEIIVKRQQPERACALLGYCAAGQSLPPRPAAPAAHNTQQSHSGEDGEGSWAFVVTSDMHVGQKTDNAPWLNRVTIDKINRLTQRENIKMVFITGDITNSAMPEQWAEAKAMLANLRVPYVPVLGNHDIWSYNATYEAPGPTGDFQFAATFKDVLADPRIPAAVRFTYNNRTSFNPDHGIVSWFQNWELQLDDFVFFGLDWISRAHAVSELGYKGGWPGAALQDFPGGTFPWLQQRLEALRDDNRTVVFLQHHPFAMPIFIPEAIYSFAYADKMRIRELTRANGRPDKYWGVLAGHLHIWFDGLAFSGDQQRQWLTEASKVGSALTLVRVRQGRIVSLEKLFGYDYE